MADRPRWVPAEDWSQLPIECQEWLGAYEAYVAPEGPCPYCGDLKGYWLCRQECRYVHETIPETGGHRYLFPPPNPCEQCGSRAWEMWDGWCCMICNPGGPWVVGFGPDDDRPPTPLIAMTVKAIAARALGIPADDVALSRT